MEGTKSAVGGRATCGLYSKIMCACFLPEHHYDLEVVIRLVINLLPVRYHISVSLFLSSRLLQCIPFKLR